MDFEERVGSAISGAISGVTLVWFLWNWLMPSIFGLKTINFFQAFGLILLAQLLLGTTGNTKKDN